MPSEHQLIAGLEAQDWRETASISCDWRRFGKFGRGAAYVILHDCKVSQPAAGGVVTPRAGELWFSPLHQQAPQVQVIGPILEQVLAAGRVDSTALLIDLMDFKKDSP